MKNSYVGMGCFYRANPYGLVKTVCRAIDAISGDVVIAYVNVGKGGYVVMFLSCLKPNL